MKNLEIKNVEIITEIDEKNEPVVRKIEFNTKEYDLISCNVKETVNKKVEMHGLDIVERSTVNAIGVELFVSRYPNIVELKQRVKDYSSVRAMIPVRKFTKEEDGVVKTIVFVDYKKLGEIKFVEGGER